MVSASTDCSDRIYLHSCLTFPAPFVLPSIAFMCVCWNPIEKLSLPRNIDELKKYLSTCIEYMSVSPGPPSVCGWVGYIRYFNTTSLFQQTVFTGSHSSCPLFIPSSSSPSSAATTSTVGGLPGTEIWLEEGDLPGGVLQTTPESHEVSLGFVINLTLPLSLANSVIHPFCLLFFS